MFKLSYIIGVKTIESFIFPAVGLARWKKKTITAASKPQNRKINNN